MKKNMANDSQLKSEKSINISMWLAFLIKPSIFPYLGILLILFSAFKPHPTGDTAALLSGLKTALGCLAAMPMKIPCGAEVVHFPIFQYLLGSPFSLMGLDNHTIAIIFVYMNLIWTIIAGVAFWRAGFLAAGQPGGHLGILILLSGYLIYYMSSSFNEAAAFAVFALLVLSIIDRWRILYVCVIASACTITKEVAFPFVIYFMFLAYLAREFKINNYLVTLHKIVQFIVQYKLPILSIIIGIIINFAFNYFRFGSIKNLSNFDPRFFTPWEFVPQFFGFLFFSPAGGLLFVWFSLCMLLVLSILFLVRDRATNLIMAFIIFGVLFANLGLARWYSPFGWYAWGPRLTLPFLGAMGVLSVHVIAPHLIKFLNHDNKKIWLFVVFTIVAISSLPNIAVLIDEGAFFNKMFAPTQIAIDSKIEPFTVRTGPPNLYMQASKEMYSRNILIPVTMTIMLNTWPIILLWLWSLFYICQQLVPTVKEQNHVNIN